MYAQPVKQDSPGKLLHVCRHANHPLLPLCSCYDTAIKAPVQMYVGVQRHSQCSREDQLVVLLEGVTCQNSLLGIGSAAGTPSLFRLPHH